MSRRSEPSRRPGRRSARRAPRRAALAVATAVALAGCIVLVPGCSSLDQRRFHFWSHEPLSDAYQKALEHWTRESEVPEDLTLRLGLSATLLADPFRADLEQEAERLLDLPRGASWSALASPVPGGVDVVVAVAAPTDRELALEAATPYWNLYLIDAAGEHFRPARIKRIDDRSPERRLFPFHDRWSRLYLVSFPPSVPHDSGAGPLVLEATGVYGRTQVSWAL